MTLRIFKVLSSATATSLSLSLFLAPAYAGLEIMGQPSRTKKHDEGTTNGAPTRVQVFGNGDVKPAPVTRPEETSASDYAEMLKKDEEVLQTQAPEAAPAIIQKKEIVQETTRTIHEDSSDEKEFEALRGRIRSRQTAEATSDTMSTEVYTPAARPRRIPSTATVTGRTPPRPAAKVMETETITPQAPQRGTKVPTARPAQKEAALEEDTGNSSSSSSESNAAFPYTHLLPSPFNISQGSWVIGTTAAYGVFDFLQVSTNVVRLANQQWNFQAKVPLIDFPTFMATAYVDYESFNPNHYSNLNPDFHYKRWQPGLVTAYELNEDMALFLGGNFSFGDDPYPVVRTSGYLKGARIEADWSWLYNPSSSRLGNNALSVGVTYDTTYSMFGFGLTHHWRSFSAGIHYTFADQDRFLPIFGFNVGSNF